MQTKIEKIIEQEIRPLLVSHGGGIELSEITADNYVKIRLLGACSNCPAQQQTVENLVESLLREQIPEIKGVLLEQQVSAELIEQALSIIRKGQQV